MATKYLDANGLLYLWNKIKSVFIVKEAGKGLSTNDYSTAEKEKLADLTNYVHPTHAAKSNGLYKVTIDGTGHVSAATAAAKADITGLGIPGETTEVVDSLASGSTVAALSARQGAVLKALIDGLSLEAGSNCMLKLEYDVDDDGIVDDAAKLGGQLPSFYENALTMVKVNGTAQTISGKAVDIAVPMNNSQLVNDSGFQTAVNVKNIVEEYGYQTAAQVASALDAAVSSVYKPSGSYAFASLPAPSAETLGCVYNVTNAFSTTSSFLEGTGHTHPAGTNVVVIMDGSAYKFDTLAGMVDLTDYMLAAEFEVISNHEIDAICA